VIQLVVDTFSILAWKKSEIGFVVGVLVVIVAVSGIQLKLGQMKTRDAQRKADVELVGRALTVYLEDHRILPMADAGRVVGCGYLGGEACEWDGGPMIDNEGVVYLKKMPIDPFNYRGWKYVYEVSPDGQKFKVSAALENCRSGVQCNWYAGN